MRRKKKHSILNYRDLFYFSVYKSQNLMHSTHHMHGNKICVTHCQRYDTPKLSPVLYYLPTPRKQETHPAVHAAE